MPNVDHGNIPTHVASMPLAIRKSLPSLDGRDYVPFFPKVIDRLFLKRNHCCFPSNVEQPSARLAIAAPSGRRPVFTKANRSTFRTLPSLYNRRNRFSQWITELIDLLLLPFLLTNTHTLVFAFHCGCAPHCAFLGLGLGLAPLTLNWKLSPIYCAHFAAT